MNLFFLHGFLGRPSDWDEIKSSLPRHEKLRVFVPDYFNETALSPVHKFQTWTENFTKWVESLGCSADRNVLVGYSLGGRLALHALEHKPSLWYKTLCISTNPGFNDFHDNFEPSSEERRLRWLNDSYWAEEFLKAPWDMLLRNWNAQSVFSGGDKEPQRHESEYFREALGLALTQWSLAQQKNMRSVIQKHLNKVLWLVGERDEKFVELSRRMSEEIPQFRFEVVPEASHRVLFDNPTALNERVRILVQQLL